MEIKKKMLETKIILKELEKGKLSEGVAGLIKDEITMHLLSTKRQGIADFVKYLETSDFFTAPASTKFHGSHKGGLCVHSLLVYRVFDFLLNSFGAELLDDSRKIIGLGHDICKIDVYKKLEPKDKSKTLAKPYKFEDRFPFGHGEKSAFIISQFIKLTEKEALLIRWHMGAYDQNYELNEDMLKKKCPELVLLHSADRIVSGWYDI